MLGMNQSRRGYVDPVENRYRLTQPVREVPASSIALIAFQMAKLVLCMMAMAMAMLSVRALVNVGEAMSKSATLLMFSSMP
jgi:hypothetical protein